MADQHCLCPAPPLVEAVRSEAVTRALEEFDEGELDAAERAAVASLADRLTARLAVLATASCPKHGPSAARGHPGGTGRPRCASSGTDR